jgi:PAS domain S-box-containing protein
MSSAGHLPELELLRSQVADLSRELAERDRVAQDLREQADLLRAIVEGTAAETGEEFFSALVTHLTSVLKVRYAVIGEVQGDRIKKIRTLAVSAGGALVDNFEYELAHTPCATALTQTFACFDRGVQATFPQFQRLADLGAESYCAVPLRTKDGAVIGLLVVMDTKPLQHVDDLQSLLKVFAPRVAVEFERRRAEQERAMAPADLHNVMETVPDIMFTLDTQGNMVKWNRRVGEVTGYSPEELLNKSALAFVPMEEQARTAAAIQRAFTEGYAELDGFLLTKDHRTIPYHWTGAALKDPQGQVIGITGVGRDVAERKRLEEERRAQHARLVAAEALAHVGSWEWDLDSGVMEWSDEQFRIFGHEPQSMPMTHKSFLASLLPDDHDPVLAVINDALAGKASYDVECRIVRPNGEVRTIHCHGEVSRDDNGHPVSMSGSALDLTDRKQAELALRQSEEHFRALIEYSSDIITVLGLDGTIRFESPSFERILGYAQQELNGRIAFEFVHEDDLPGVLERFQLVVQRPGELQTAEFRFRHKDGSWRNFEGIGQAIRDPQGLRSVIVNSRDITERKRTEWALVASKKQLQDILDSVFGFIALYTLDGRIVEINRAPLELGGVAKGDVLGRYFWEIPWWSGLPDMQSRLQDWMSRAAQGELIRGELVFRVPGGHMATAEAIFEPLRDADGAIINVIGFGVDITERKRAEEALRSSEFGLIAAQRLARIGSWELDLRTNNLTWSDEIYRIFEIDPAAFQASYEGFLNLVHPDDREMVDRAYSDSVASRAPYDITHRLLMKDGRIKFVQERCQTDYLPDGTPKRSMGTVQDITERKQTEDALQFLSTGIAHLSGEVFFSEMAVQVAKLLGLEIGFVGKLLPTQTQRIRAVGLSIDGQALPPVEYDLARTPCERVIGKQTVIFTEHVQQLFPDDQMLADLGISSYAAIPLFDMNGRAIGHVGVMSRRPLRQVKQVEDLLRLFAVRAAAELERQRMETKFHDLFEFSPDAIIMVNQEGLITLANRQAESLFGYSRAEFLGLPVETLMPESEQHGPAGLRQKFLSAATLRMMGMGSSELHALKKDGTIFPIDISLRPIQTEDGLLVAAAVRDITDRKRVEESLRESEERYRILTEVTFDGIAIHDQGILFNVNHGLERMFGYAPGELTGKHILDLVADESRDMVIANMRQGLSGPYESVGRRKDGSTFYVEVVVKSHRYQGREVRLVAGRDITERKRVQAQEAVRLQRLKQLATWSLTLAGEPGDVFAEAVRIIGELFGVRTVCLSEIVGTELYFNAVFIAGQVVRDAGHCPLAITPCAMVETTKDLRVFDRVMERFPEASFLRDHQAVAYCGIPSLDSRGQVVAVTCLLDDRPHEFSKEEQDLLRIFGQRIAAEIERSRHAAEHKRAADELRRSHAFIRQIIDADPNFIFVKNRACQFTLVNKAVANAYGTTVEHLLGKTDADFNVNQEEVEFFRQKDLEVMDSLHGCFIAEEVITDSMGKTRWLQTVKQPILDDQGRAIMVLGASTDITDRKRMEEALRQRERQLRAALEERERISQDLHDGILQSLFAVGLTLEASKSMMSPRARKTSGAPLDQAIDQLNRVMREIRNFIAGLGSDLLQGKDLPMALQRMLESLTQNHATRVRLVVEDRAVQAVSAEQSQHLFLVIQEAVSNCIRHSRAQEARVSLKLLKQGVRLSIRDNGRGFNQDAAKGTGHGLVNMAARAQKIGGRFTILSKVNEGTRIVLDLPNEAADVRR